MLDNDESVQAVGKRLKHLRSLAGLKRGQLAEKADVNPASISYWENARLKNLQATSVKKLIDAFLSYGLFCTQTWLLKGIGPEPYLINQSGNNNQSISISTSNKEPIYESKTDDERELFKKKFLNTVIIRLNDDNMLPFFTKGDYIGGLWYTNINELVIPYEGINCIVDYQNIIEARRIFPTENNLSFNIIYTSYSDYKPQGFSLKNIEVTRLAPIIRHWKS